MPLRGRDGGPTRRRSSDRLTRCKAVCKIARVVITHRPSVRRLTRAPLVMVLCEVRFSPVLTMESHVPTIQDALRRCGFPGFERAVMQQIEFAPDGPPRFSADQRWFFRSKGRTRVASLSTSAVTLQATDYSQFESFLSSLELVLKSVQTVVQPAYYERIGLRYVNAIEDAGDSITRLFRENVLSFSADELGVTSLLTAQHVIGNTPNGQIVLRMNQVEDKPLLPLDLVSPEFPELSRPRNGVHAILDIDGSDTQSGDFLVEDLEARLWGIHEYTERGFWKSTTAAAHEEWGLVSDDKA
jgi:uncharacterized protein (TIGR04255 family)